jgi:hypothetical protein
MYGKLRNVVLWEYSRETSVYVIFCLLIVGFIFLTPKEWFDKKETLATKMSRLVVQERDYSPERAVLEKRVREISGDPNAEIVSVSPKRNERGETFYEIDIK